MTSGNIVQLKTGSPNMTISHIERLGVIGERISAKCIWFENGIKKEDSFPEKSLILINEINENNITLEGMLLGQETKIECKDEVHAKRIFTIINNYFTPDIKTVPIVEKWFLETENSSM